MKLYRTYLIENVEKVNPLEFFKSYEINKRSKLLRDILFLKSPNLATQLKESFFIKEAEKTLMGFFEQFENIEVHKNLLSLLNTTKKKKQESLLKGIELNPDQLMSLIIKSYKDFGFLYSKYHFQKIPSNFREKRVPLLIQQLDNGSIEKIGKSEFKDGELKNIFLQRKVIDSHFLEKEDFWHCFFITYNSINGEENWQNGQPHFHYISSSFNISKNDFIESLKNGKYISTSIHIALLGYGNQPKR